MRLPLTLCLVLLGACSTYLPGYDYVPRPHETQLRTRFNPTTGETDERLQARVLVSVIGVIRASEDSGNHDLVHIRILIENLSSDPMTFLPDQGTLTTANLRVCQLVSTEPPGETEIAPAQSQELNLTFALPQGFEESDMTGLNLKWTVKILGKEVTRSSAFERIELRASPYYYDGFYYHYGFGAWCW